MANLSPFGPFRAFDNSGNPLSGGKLYTYEAGTSTPKATYTTASGAVSNANPVVLNSSGYADIWLGTGGYKFVLKTSADATLWTIDDIGGDSPNAFGSTITNVSTNTVVTSLYQNGLIRCTAALTLSLLTAATAGEGFYFLVTNTSSGNVTVDPDGSETIDGSSTYTLYPNDSVIIMCNGTAWFTAFSLPVAGVTTNQISTSGASGVVFKNSAGATAMTVGASAGTAVNIVGNLTLGGTLSGASLTSNTVPYAAIASSAIASTAEIASGTASKLVDAAGLLPMKYGARLYQTAGISISNNAWTNVTFDAESWDDNTWHSIVTNTDRVTFDFTGRVSVACSYNSGTNANGSYGIRIVKNAGATVIAEYLTGTNTTGAAGNVHVSLCDHLAVTSGDYICMEVYQNSGGSVTTGSGEYGTTFSIMRIK